MRMAEPKIAAVKIQVLPNRALPVQGVELRHHSHEPSGFGRMSNDVHGCNRYLAAGGKRAGGANTDGRGFAGAIRTEQAEQLSAGNGEVDSLHRLNRRLARIRLYQSLNVDN